MNKNLIFFTFFKHFEQGKNVNITKGNIHWTWKKIICNYPGVVSIRYFILFAFKRQRSKIKNEKKKRRNFFWHRSIIMYFIFILLLQLVKPVFSSKCSTKKSNLNAKNYLFILFASSFVSLNRIDEHTSNTIRFPSSFPFAICLRKHMNEW